MPLVSGHAWYHGVLRKEFDRVHDAFRFGLVSEDPMVSVMFHRWAKIPSFGSMWILGFALLWFFMNYYLCSWWCQWCFVVIEGSFQHVVRRDFGIASGWS
jgi:hypothetical protein